MRTGLAFISFISFLLLAAAPRAAFAQDVACTQDAMQCPNGSYVSRVAPHCEFAPCPDASVLHPEPEPPELTSCEEDVDCLIVPYANCCGATRRAINSAQEEQYKQHKVWQSDFGSECAKMGVCPDDSEVVQARCAREENKPKGKCELIYPEVKKKKEIKDESPAKDD